MIFFLLNVVSCRNQTVKKLTMGYITNYSYCTAMVSSSVVFWKKRVKIYLWNICLPKNTCKIFIVIKASCSNNLTIAPCKFYFIYRGQFPQIHKLFFFLSPGVRTEQDLYIRLIDSMTKQVSCCCTFSFLLFLLFFFNARCNTAQSALCTNLNSPRKLLPQQQQQQ